jgi:hypothetical protein
MMVVVGDGNGESLTDYHGGCSFYLSVQPSSQSLYGFIHLHVGKSGPKAWVGMASKWIQVADRQSDRSTAIDNDQVLTQGNGNMHVSSNG